MALPTLFARNPRLKYIFIAVVVLGVLIGGMNAHFARAASPQSYIVLVGASGGTNTDFLQFAPGALKVHRGDTITWVIQGFHDVHVGGTKPADLVIAPTVDGKPLPQLNPAIAFPYGAKSGSSYQGGEAGSGVPMGPDASPLYSLVVDVKPGTTFAVLCDIHPGMASSVTVAEDSETIPGPSDVMLQAAAEFGASAGASSDAAGKVAVASGKMMNSVGGKATVQMGNDVGRAATNQFFPFATVIKAGESVTWKFGDGAIEPHTVTSASLSLDDFTPMPQQGKPPVLAMGPGLAPETQPAVTVKSTDTFHSGLIIPIPGQLPTYTLTFTDPGVYPYVCHIHPGMTGVVVVTAR